jgi:hypothetical protein
VYLAFSSLLELSNTRIYLLWSPRTIHYRWTKSCSTRRHTHSLSLSGRLKRGHSTISTDWGYPGRRYLILWNSFCCLGHVVIYSYVTLPSLLECELRFIGLVSHTIRGLLLLICLPLQFDASINTQTCTRRLDFGSSCYLLLQGASFGVRTINYRKIKSKISYYRHCGNNEEIQG